MSEQRPPYPVQEQAAGEGDFAQFLQAERASIQTALDQITSGDSEELDLMRVAEPIHGIAYTGLARTLMGKSGDYASALATWRELRDGLIAKKTALALKSNLIDNSLRRMGSILELAAQHPEALEPVFELEVPPERIGEKLQQASFEPLFHLVKDRLRAKFLRAGESGEIFGKIILEWNDVLNVIYYNERFNEPNLSEEEQVLQQQARELDEIRKQRLDFDDPAAIPALQKKIAFQEAYTRYFFRNLFEDKQKQ